MNLISLDTLSHVFNNLIWRVTYGFQFEHLFKIITLISDKNKSFPPVFVFFTIFFG